jgi:hypothetical protein
VGELRARRRLAIRDRVRHRSPPDVYLLDVAASRNGVAVAACAATRQPQHTMGTHLKKRADFDEPVFPWHLGGMVELSAVA